MISTIHNPMKPGKEGASREVSARLSRLRAVLMLAGSVRRSRLMAASQRSLVELPLTSEQTVLDHWRGQLDLLAVELGVDRLICRILFNAEGYDLTRLGLGESARVSFRVEVDPKEYRGTGGLVCDCVQEYDDDDTVLIVNGGQVLLEPLSRTVGVIGRRQEEVTVLGHLDGTPAGIVLARVGVLKQIRGDGFVDLKEQALPELAKSLRVGVYQCDTRIGLPIRTIQTYIQALRERDGHAPQPAAGFAVIERGASVHRGALVHDAVILRGATVDDGGMVVRSVVGPGARIRRGQMVVDDAVGGEAQDIRV